MPDKETPRRAITLGGGGPAAGLHIGVLDALAQHDINFDVWSLSCIGAWVGIVYNQFDEKISAGEKVEKTFDFFKNGVFRDDEGYKHFPINKVFGSDWRNNIDALNKFVADPKNYRDFQWQPYNWFDWAQQSWAIVADYMPRGEKPPKQLTEGDFNRWILNQVMAPNPFIRYLTSMMYLSNVNGLSKINYPDSDFMKDIEFGKLYGPDKPFIFHNAWNLDDHELAFFANRPMPVTTKPGHKIKRTFGGRITAESLCACSALPFVEETVEINKVTYCEGALVDTVNFENLTDLDVDEIWVSRIVDSQQIRKPKNLHDALANLCQLFAATVGEDDVRLFKYHVKFDKPAWAGTVVEIHVPGNINFKWNHSNLKKGRMLGERAAQQAIKEYKKNFGKKGAGKVQFINEKPELDPEWQKLRDDYLRQLKKDSEAS